MKLLCAADLHLGRRPSRLPDDLSDFAELAEALTPRAAWRRLVDVALAEDVSAVLLAGDLLDDEHDFFETFGDLQLGVERLIDAGVEVLAVSGNHDLEVLPKLAAAVPGLRQLGTGGVWEVATLSRGSVTVHVAGWSFPGPVVAASPLPALPATLTSLAPGRVVGLLHCDRDQAGSRYGPVTSLELRSAPVDVWLLGHVHKADFGPLRDRGSLGDAGLHGADGRPRGGAGGSVTVRIGDRLGGYLGTISPADPGEEGSFGAWLLEFGSEESGAVTTASHLPLAGLRYETAVLDVGTLTDPHELAPAIATAVTDARSRSDPSLRALGLRLRLTGRSRIRSELAASLARDDPRGIRVHPASAGDGPVVFVHDCRLEALPAFDLAEVAAGHGPRALVARKLLLLSDDTAAGRAELLATARTRLETVAGGKYYLQLPPPDLTDAALVDLLEQAALQLLDAMSPP